MRKQILVLLVMVAAIPFIAYGQELSDAKIVTDYKEFLERPRSADCRAAVKLTDIQVADKEFEEDTATVTITVTGDWISEKAVTFYADPCSGFWKARGNNQKVEKTLFYRLDEKEWKLEGFQ